MLCQDSPNIKYLINRSLTVRLPEGSFQITSLLYYFIVYVNSSKIALSCRFRLIRKAAAKVRTFSIIFQIFSKLFSNYFFRRRFPSSTRRARQENSPEKHPEVSHLQSLSLSISTASFPKAGAKVEGLYEPAKSYNKFFPGKSKVFSSKVDYQYVIKHIFREAGI